jgi:hypothetical protein
MITYDEFKKALKDVNDYTEQHQTELRKALNIVNVYIDQHESDLIEADKEINIIDQKLYETNGQKKFTNKDCSSRLYNCIYEKQKEWGLPNHELKISDLSKISITEFLKCRNIGVLALEELKTICSNAGVSLRL